MLEPLFFSVGVVNGVALTVIFVLRERRLDLVRQFGYLYLLLAIPAAYGIVLVLQEEKPAQYAIFLSIFLAFLAIEALTTGSSRSPSGSTWTGARWCRTWPCTSPPATSPMGSATPPTWGECCSAICT